MIGVVEQFGSRHNGEDGVAVSSRFLDRGTFALMVVLGGVRLGMKSE